MKSSGNRKSYRAVYNQELLNKLNMLETGMLIGNYACCSCIHKAYKNKLLINNQSINDEPTLSNTEQNLLSGNFN